VAQTRKQSSTRSGDKATGKKQAKSTGAKKGAAKRPSRAGRDAPAASPSRSLKPLQLAQRAAEQVAELTGREPESTIGVERTDDGWRIQLEVVESRRIPDSSDVMAVYDVEVDTSGDLLGYRRVDRYPRGRAGRGDGGGR